MSLFKKSPQLAGTLIGFGVAVSSAVILFSSADPPGIELQTYDWRVRHCNTLAAAPSIIHVDIDDGSLDRVGRWPWSREMLADVIRVLRELGARFILVDLLLSEPEVRRIEDPSLGRDADIQAEIEVVGALSEANKVYGDLELAEAIRSAGNVIMAAQWEIIAPGEPDPWEVQLERLWRESPSRKAGDLVSSLALPRSAEWLQKVERELLRIRLYDRLLRDFTLSEQELASQLGVDIERVDAVIAGAKHRAAVDLVARGFQGGRQPSLETLCEEILGQDKDRENKDRADVKMAYRVMLGRRAQDKALIPLSAEEAGRLYRSRESVPLYFEFAASALDIAAVNFVADPDGGTRRVPLVIGHEGRAIKHLGFAAAVHALDLDMSGFEVPDAYTLRIPFKDWTKEPLEVPLDGKGNLVIPWTRTGPRWRLQEDFPHISVAKVWQLIDARRQIEKNNTMIDYLLADVVAASSGEITVTRTAGDERRKTEVGSGDTRYRRLVNQQLDIERRLHRARLFRDAGPEEIAALQVESNALLETIRTEQQNAVSTVELMCAELDAEGPEAIEKDPELQALASRYRPALALIQKDIARLRLANEGLAGTIERVKSQLAPKLGDKYVFLGYAATAQGDIVSTPIDPSTNGVMCHANVLNAFLNGRFVRTVRAWKEVLVCLLLALIVSVVTAVRAPRFALVTSVGIAVTYTYLLCYVLYQGFDTWFALSGTVVTLFVTWAFVTLYRQLTAERDKRLFIKQLSQYTSPAIALKIAESPKAAQAFKAVQKRDITSFFSDLKGFTSITEREDAENIQHVLNMYLESMSQVIWSHRGLINKFMGDGIMAFFNSSVDPLPNHAGIACEAALATFEALEKLKLEKADEPDGRIIQQLEMRVGIATGMCMNGDMGSELKADYTVIGDVVNLAARLEPANKVFGTKLLVSGPVHEQLKDQYEFRYLAELQVKGKDNTVPVYEIICRQGELSEDQGRYATRFEEGVELYKQRKWDECIVHFTRMLSRKFDDVGASRYIDACQELKTFTPDDDWCGALELKEK